MSRQGRSQPIQPVVSHGFVGNIPPNGDSPGQIIVVENDDRSRRRFLPLPPFAGNSIYATVTAPVVVTPPLPTFTPVQQRRDLPATSITLKGPTPATFTTPATPPPPVVVPITGSRTLPLPPVVSRPPVFDVFVTTTIGELVLGAVAPSPTVGTVVTTTIGDLTLGAVAPTFSIGGSVTTTIGNLSLDAVAPTIVFTGSVVIPIGNLVLDAALANLNISGSGTVSRRPSFSYVIIAQEEED